MGKPVLASDLGGMTETILPGETGWLVRPGDPDAWAHCLAHALDLSPAKRQAMGQAAANRATRLYSVDAMCAAYLSAYARVLEARG